MLRRPLRSSLCTAIIAPHAELAASRPGRYTLPTSPSRVMPMCGATQKIYLSAQGDLQVWVRELRVFTMTDPEILNWVETMNYV
jgi:hypothetical protein